MNPAPQVPNPPHRCCVAHSRGGSDRGAEDQHGAGERGAPGLRQRGGGRTTVVSSPPAGLRRRAADRWRSLRSEACALSSPASISKLPRSPATVTMLTWKKAG